MTVRTQKKPEETALVKAQTFIRNSRPRGVEIRAHSEFGILKNVGVGQGAGELQSVTDPRQRVPDMEGMSLCTKEHLQKWRYSSSDTG